MLHKLYLNAIQINTIQQKKSNTNDDEDDEDDEDDHDTNEKLNAIAKKFSYKPQNNVDAFIWQNKSIIYILFIYHLYIIYV